MDDRQRDIFEDLGGLLEGEVRGDAPTRAMYATDASLHQIRPLGVAFPKSTRDVSLLARYAADESVPLIPRGAGTGLAGQAIGAGIIVDFSRHMRGFEWVGPDSVRVQPGLVRDRLNEFLRPYGRYFAPDPSNSALTTIGGMLGVDAAGSHSIRIGSMRDHVQSIEMVLAGGEIVELGNEPLDLLRWPPESLAGDASGDGAATTRRTLVSRLAALLGENERLIDERQPPLVRNCAGYFLRGVLTDGRVNFPRLLVGSEGTLGLFTAATLHTSPLPAYRAVALLLFGELEAAVHAVRLVARRQPSACDLLDRRLLSLAREADPRFAELISPAAEAALIVEVTGYDDEQAADGLRQVISDVRRACPDVAVPAEASTPGEVEFLWSLPGTVVPLLTRLKGATRPMPFVEDVAVPPEALHEFLVEAQKVFQRHRVTATLYSHAAAGQVHLRPFLTPEQAGQGHVLRGIAGELYRAVFALGGTVSGEHGDGLSRTSFLKEQYGPLYDVFREVKDIFDPRNVLNPGKIISDAPDLTERFLRPPPLEFRPLESSLQAEACTPAAATGPLVELQLRWKPEELAAEAARCNGCGVCRTQAEHLRMCPFFRHDPAEEASPRAKANVTRHLLSGSLTPEEFASPEMKRIANLCFNCKQCRLECPSNVNIPQMMIEAKAAHVAAHGLRRADWILSRAHSFGALGCSAAFAANWFVASPVGRWLLQELFGIHRLRKLPLFARRSFLRSAGRNLLRAPRPEDRPRAAIYFVDHYANFHDPELAQAFVAILRHNRIPVHVPPEQTASGMAMVSAGDLESARELALENVRVLAEFAREGHPIVCTEPAAALCLKHEYPILVDHTDVDVVAARTIEAGAFLLGLHAEGRLRTDFQPLDLDVGYHTPCHLKALEQGTPLARLLSLIPELRLHRIEKGCSGMAGAYGLTKQNFATSVRLGWDLIDHMRSDRLHAGTTECSSCKIQMEQGTATPTLHPLKLLALAYGLMPEIRRKLKPSTRKLVVT
ncbi:MAG: FAD-linked oxidase C-terminal domain-containing protein [Planctomycetales bacterium]